MTSRVATCSCGRLRVTCDGDPLSVTLCHCPACQRRTGSAFGVAAFFEETRVRVEGPSTTYTRPSDSGHPVTFHFCPTCGTSLFWFPSRLPGKVAVAVGAFADPTFPAPGKGVHADHRHPWVDLA